MQLDEYGNWIDPGIIDGDIGFRIAAKLGIDPSCLEVCLPPDLVEFEGMIIPNQIQNLPPEEVPDEFAPGVEPPN